jgi:uncharacterized membrane protein YedE/YeeE
MVGAILVHALALQVIGRRRAPLAAQAFSAAPSARIDGALLLGSASFGVGWGLSGYCPGPSVVSLPVAGVSGLVFVASLALGNLAVSALKSPRLGRARPPALQS